jgi:hypothetical protein
MTVVVVHAAVAVWEVFDGVVGSAFDPVRPFGVHPNATPSMSVLEVACTVFCLIVDVVQAGSCGVPSGTRVHYGRFVM